ncbi:protein DMP6-like [Cocos nucifera]|nr:protein DMP6-like [Cocos nucifera]
MAMEPRKGDEEAQRQQQQQQPLLIPESSNNDRKTPKRKAIRKTFKKTAHLANLLPTGTVLAFQLLSPIFTNQGRCNGMNWYMTAGLVALCGLSCFIQSFTDSFRDESGKVRHGLATFRGLWVIDGTAPLPPEVAIKYRIKFIDLVHALMSILVFAAVALLDQNVVSCLYPNPSEEMKQVLTSLPIGIGVSGSLVFVAFPSTRHGIGFPLSSR